MTNTTTKQNTKHPISLLNRILCQVAGSDLATLAQCPHEVLKHSCIGLILLSTAFLASVSMNFAIRTLSKNSGIIMAAAIVWGIIIFFIDRYIIASYRKRADKGNEFVFIIPRICIALLLGSIISIPLELEIFRDDVKKQMEMENKVVIMTKLQNKRQEAHDIEQELQKHRATIVQDRHKISDAIKTSPNRTKTTRVTDQSGKTTVNTSNTPVIDPDDQKEKKRLDGLIAKIDSEITEQQNLIESNQSQINRLQEQTPLTDFDDYGLLQKIKALHVLIANDVYVMVAYFLFLALILCVELAPVMTKFFTPATAYDKLIESTERLIEEKAKDRENDLKNEIQLKALKHSYAVEIEKKLGIKLEEVKVKAQEQANEKFLETELEILITLGNYRKDAQQKLNKKIIDETTDAQIDLGTQAIELWKEIQLKQMPSNLDNFIHVK